ncbi:MAG TPA: DMT family transporter [Anaerolineales bacterium]
MTGFEWGLFLGLGLLWGSSFMWIKIAVAELGPFAVVGWRLLFGVAGMLLVILFRRPPWPRQLRDYRNLIFLGLINTALPFVLITWGEQTVDSAVASVLNSTVPLFTLVIAHFALADDRMTSQRVIGLSLGFIGVLVLMSRDLLSGQSGGLLGQLAVLVAALSYACAAVFARRTMRQVDSFIQSFVPMLAADALVWAIAFPREAGNLVPSLPITWLAIAWLGLLGSCLAYLLYFILLHRVGPTRTTMVTYMFPVVGVGLGVVFLSEQLDWRLAVGAVAVVLGMALVNRKPRVAELEPRVEPEQAG